MTRRPTPRHRNFSSAGGPAAARPRSSSATRGKAAPVLGSTTTGPAADAGPWGTPAAAAFGRPSHAMPPPPKILTCDAPSSSKNSKNAAAVRVTCWPRGGRAVLRPGPARGRSVPGSRQARPPGEATAVPPNTWWSSSTGTTCHRDMTFHGLRLMTSGPLFRGGWVGAPGDRGGGRGGGSHRWVPPERVHRFNIIRRKFARGRRHGQFCSTFSPCGTTQIGRSGPGRGPGGDGKGDGIRGARGASGNLMLPQAPGNTRSPDR